MLAVEQAILRIAYVVRNPSDGVSGGTATTQSLCHSIALFDHGSKTTPPRGQSVSLGAARGYPDRLHGRRETIPLARHRFGHRRYGRVERHLAHGRVVERTELDTLDGGRNPDRPHLLIAAQQVTPDGRHPPGGDSASPAADSAQNRRPPPPPSDRPAPLPPHSPRATRCTGKTPGCPVAGWHWGA